MDWPNLDQSGFTLVKQLFLFTNTSRGYLAASQSMVYQQSLRFGDHGGFTVRKLPLQGVQQLWETALHCRDANVAEQAMTMLQHLCSKTSLASDLAGSALSQYEGAVATCMRQMAAYSPAATQGVTRVAHLPIRRALMFLRDFLRRETSVSVLTSSLASSAFGSGWDSTTGNRARTTPSRSTPLPTGAVLCCSVPHGPDGRARHAAS